MSTPPQSGGQPPAVTIAMILDTLTATKDELTATKGEIVRLRSYGRHNRAFVIVDVLLTVLLTAFGYLSVHATQSADQAKSQQIALCRSGNEARAQQVGLWEYLIHLSPPPKTAQARKVLTEFERHLHIVFAARNCDRLGR